MCWFNNWCWSLCSCWYCRQRECRPALTNSFLIAGIAAALSAFCYVELSSQCPSAGSAYHYSYIGVGERVAWIIGWALILEYTIGGSTVARGIPRMALVFGGKASLPSFMPRIQIPGTDIVVDPCATTLVLLVTTLLCIGIKEIIALRRAKRRNMERLVLACGGEAVNSADDLTVDCLGGIGLFYEHILGEEKHTFMENVKNPRSCTIFDQRTNRFVKNTIEDEAVVLGAGAFEVAETAFNQQSVNSVHKSESKLFDTGRELWPRHLRYMPYCNHG